MTDKGSSKNNLNTEPLSTDYTDNCRYFVRGQAFLKPTLQTLDYYFWLGLSVGSGQAAVGDETRNLKSDGCRIISQDISPCDMS